MPFEQTPVKQKKIAVIGAGISGLGAAYLLSDTHRVTLFEAEKRLGGHARTVIAGKRGDQPVDTGFIVFNHVNYPHLSNLFRQLDVPVVKSNMSFGASFNGGALEYSLLGLDTLFAQRRNILRPSYLRMMRDLFYFNANAERMADDPSMTVRELLEKMGTGDWFRDYYLLPFSGAIWSTPRAQVLDFPAYGMVRFFKNHALLNHTGQHQWYTVEGGSDQYVQRLAAAMTGNGVDIRLGAPIQAVQRNALGVTVKPWGAEAEAFDEVVFATHSDDALKMLVDAGSIERACLGEIAYQPNHVTLHRDPSVMPNRRKVWSSWCYTEPRGAKSDTIDLTYWMNSLQPIPHDDPHFVTLNDTGRIREELIYDQVTMRHPVYGAGVLEAQDTLRAVNGTNRTWFCGAWMRHGFHEDGLASAAEVVEAMRHTTALAIAAE